MGKAEEAAAKRRNKAARKRLRSAGGAGFHTAVIAAKRRRKAGKRRVCEGMCYSLPTPEDPFNNRSLGKRKKRRYDDETMEGLAEEGSDLDEGQDGSQVLTDEADSSEDDEISEARESASSEEDDSSEEEEDSSGGEDDTRAYDRRLLSRIAGSSNGARILSGVIASVDRQLSRFETSLWEACRGGLDVIGTVQESTIAAIAYVPAVVDYIVKQPSKTRLSGKPIALFLVPSQEEALYVRNLCKPLKKLLGLQTISIHPGASLEHQVKGLESSACQVLVATPERLCQLVSRKALNLLDVSFLVVDGLDELIRKGFKENLQTIKLHTSHTMQVVILSRSFSGEAIQVTRSYVEDPVARVLESESLKEQGACITQDVSIIVDDSKKLPKVVSILQQLREDDGKLPRTLVVARKLEDVVVLAGALKREGFDRAVAFTSDSKNDQNTSSFELMVSTESIVDSIDLSCFQNVVNYECPVSIARYSSILSSMARSSVHGSLHTLCGCSAAPIARELVNVLKDCHQVVPSALDMLASAAAVVIRKKP
ncbi:ATP-dependent RNA helicase DBP3-like [Selaginella moellendorffii]|uniref:ATP-dependent RNA helicase DBP3-like n=1 Tax=Selaginella moellendorffii TaxID=88036 RepID=UPI000D1C315F|nr:ATP-dependent RNA helicase DBP3-like [Selaginella moellendorffii]|eukprot:XP_024520058.1 ATP-dependent RNA helicase DBP3-like [Selaginella moellendorffii]